jgi:peptidoglycan/LPS O-acetylase OafA/YrhL
LAAFPTLSNVGAVKLNGLYETACIVVIFPLVILSGRHSEAGRGMMGLCKFAGRISYPIYMTHFPFLYVWMNFVANDHPTQDMLVVIGLALVPFLIAVAWASYAFWDEPIRARLRTVLGDHR